MSPGEVRVRAGISLVTAAASCRVCRQTLRLYEIDPSAVRGDRTRGRIDDYYGRLRVFIGPCVAEVA